MKNLIVLTFALIFGLTLLAGLGPFEQKAQAQQSSGGTWDFDDQSPTFRVEKLEGQIFTVGDDLRLPFNDFRFTFSVLNELRRKARENFRTNLKIINNRRKRAIVGGDLISLPPPGEQLSIFMCGGDITESDGTCADVIRACVTLDVSEFKCNKRNDIGECTNGGC